MLKRLILNTKLLFSRKDRLFLTLLGSALPLFLYILMTECINTYTMKEYWHLKRTDENVVLIEAENALSPEDAIIRLRNKHISFSFTKLKMIDANVSKSSVMNTKPVQINLQIRMLSGQLNGGYLPYRYHGNLYCEPVHFLYGEDFPQGAEPGHPESFCILEKSTSLLLFGTENSVGKELSLSADHAFTVCGIIEDLPSVPEENLHLNQQLRFSKEASVTGRNLFIQDTEMTNALFSDQSTNAAASIKQNAYCIFHFLPDHRIKGMEILSRADFQTGYCSIYDYRSLLEESSQLFQSLRTITGAALTVLLIICSLLIMNTMFFSIHERTVEIGIRRAVGAGKRHILLQFLYEGLLTGAAASLMSILLSFSFLSVLSWILLIFIGVDFPVSLHLRTCILTTVLSVTVSMAASLIPARYAANLQPSTSLKTML